MIWKPVVGYEDLYDVSDTGFVRSKPRSVIFFNRQMLYAAKMRSLKINKWGYVRVALSRNKEIKMYAVHRLVAEAFITNPNKYPQVNHIDCNRANNNVDNLEWCSREQNMAHAAKFGSVRRGSGSLMAKLTEKEVLEMRQNKGSLTPKELSLKYNISQPSVYAILNRRTWRHI